VETYARVYQMYTLGVQYDLPTFASAIDELKHRYNARTAGALEHDRPIVGVTSNTVPWELLSAGGLSPVLLGTSSSHDSLAGQYMEGGFDSRSRAIFGRLLSSEWSAETLVRASQGKSSSLAS